MTFRAIAVVDVRMKLRPMRGQLAVVNLLGVTAYAIFLNSIFSGLFDDDDLGLEAEGEHVGVTQAIGSLKVIVPENIILRHMAIVTGGPLAMGAVEIGRAHV